MLSASYSSSREQEYSKLHLPQLRQSLHPFLISSKLVHAENAEKPHRMFWLFVVLCGYPQKNQRGLELKIILSIENDEEPMFYDIR